MARPLSKRGRLEERSSGRSGGGRGLTPPEEGPPGLAEAGTGPRKAGGCGPLRPKKRHLARAAVLVAVHVAMIAHFAQWKLSGETLTPIEPSEAMQTLELGYVNAGFIFFGLAILATLVFGRFVCGWACHVVAYQDLCAFFLKKLGLRPKPVRARFLVWAPLVVALYMFVWPTVQRAIQDRPSPEFTLHLSTSDFWSTFPGPWIAALTVLVCGGLMVWFLGAKGFCTYGCPYGAFFGLADRVAPGRIRVTDACDGCAHCTAVCTSNVRVHEEVRAFEMVTDPGCMKCLDCVSVCPKDALYFGFGKPEVAKKTRAKRPARSFDFTIGEEVFVALVGVAGMWAWRNAYDKIPFFLAIGLGALTAITALCLVRVARAKSVRWQRYDLRRDGRLTTLGATLLPLFALWLAFGAHTGYVKSRAWLGERALERAGSRPPGDPERIAAIDDARRNLGASEAAGLFPVAILQQQLGEIAQATGDFEEAERRMNRALTINPELTRAAWWLYVYRRREVGAALRAGDLDGARAGADRAQAALERVLAIDPQFPEALTELEHMTRAREQAAPAEPGPSPGTSPGRAD